MATYIKFNDNDTLYPAVIGGKLNDADWDGRASKFIHVEMTYDEAISMFSDGVKWSIVQDVERQVETIRETTQEVIDEETQEVVEKIVEEFVIETVVEQDVYNNDDYSILGDITVHKDGTVTVKMGKPTAEEILAMFEEVL
jgi:hypothetical protein